MQRLYILLAIMLGIPSLSPAVSLKDHPSPETQASQTIKDAGRAVEEAWEAFHRAALGGTLASPAVQANIEQDLRQSRALLMAARESANQLQVSEVQRLTASIVDITERIKRESVREKL